jgi:hypothetical protein
VYVSNATNAVIIIIYAIPVHQKHFPDVKFYIKHVKFYTFPACPFYAVLSANNTAAKEENWGKTE